MKQNKFIVNSIVQMSISGYDIGLQLQAISPHWGKLNEGFMGLYYYISNFLLVYNELTI